MYCRAGYEVSFWVSSRGHVYVTGMNTYGQCGTGTKETVRTLQRVANLDKVVITRVAVPKNEGWHSLFLSNRGQVILFEELF